MQKCVWHGVVPGAKPPFEEALDAARAADVVVFVGGLTGDVEGEEMKVQLSGFRRRRPHRPAPAGNSAENCSKRCTRRASRSCSC